MSIIVPYNGVNYTIPSPGETGWGTNLDNFFVAISAGSLQKIGGSFLLASEVDFGAAFGIKTLYYKSETANIASTGILRLANSDTISWRNFANSGDLPLAVNSSNQLTYNGNPIGGSGIYTANRAVITDGSGNLVVSPTTATEISFVNGVTSSIQTQLNSKAIDTLVVHLAGTETITGTKTFPNLAILAPSGIAKETITGPSTTEIKTLQCISDNGSDTLDIGVFPSAFGGSINGHSPNNLGFVSSHASLLFYTQSVGTFLSFGVDIAGTTTEEAKIDSTGLTLTHALTVPNGGTGDTTFTPYAVIAGGTTSTGPLQSLASLGTAGFVLTSNGAGALPTFQAVTGSGTVNSGTAGFFSYYPSTGTVVDDQTVLSTDGSTQVYLATGSTAAAPLLSFAGDTDTGIYRTAANQLGITAGGTLTIKVDTAKVTIGSGTGSAGTPSIVIGSSAGSGFYTDGSSNVNVGISGTASYTFGAAEFSPATDNNFDLGDNVTGWKHVYHGNGTAALPSLTFSNDTDTGIYHVAANDIGITANGAIGFHVDATNTYVSRGQFETPDGTVGAPSLTFTSDTDTGLYRIGANSMGVSANGANIATFASTGVAIQGTTTNDNAATGFVGEYVSSNVSGNTVSGVNNQWVDVTSITLSAGDWEISVVGVVNGTTNVTEYDVGVSTTSGNSSTGLTSGDNLVTDNYVSAQFHSLCIPGYRASISGSTTYYLKTFLTFAAGSQFARGRISARRLR